MEGVESHYGWAFMEEGIEFFDRLNMPVDGCTLRSLRIA